ncbi:hypothetical protein [Arthrobacter sp. USHLN218]|uniref:hypothetical protein n=1 Tax=Arthrobacter sp. USHLN218 TaxID=3081232 RepID=UPI003018DE14
MTGMEENEQARLLVLAIEQAGISAGQLWLRYFGLGGSAGEYEVEAYLHELHSLPALQRDLLAHAANELIDQLPPRPRAPYSDQHPTGTSTAGSDTDTGQWDEEAEPN